MAVSHSDDEDDGDGDDDHDPIIPAKILYTV